jgi:hypothetical protein
MFRSADPPGNRLHAWSEQQAALAEFGLVALRGGDLDAILQRACELVARGLRAPIAKVLEALPGRDELLLRAAVGVPPEVATTERIGVVISSWRTLRIVLPSGLMSANTGVKQNAMLSMVAALLPPNGEDMVKIRSTDSPLARRPRATTPHRECSVISASGQWHRVVHFQVPSERLVLVRW